MKVRNEREASFAGAASLASDLDRSNIKLIHFNGFVVEIYMGPSFRANREALAPIAMDLYSRVFLRDAEESRSIVDGNMLHDSTVAALIRQTDESNGPYRGFLTGCKYTLCIGEGEQEAKLRVGYLSNRAFLEELRQHGLGTFLYELFPLLYHGDKEPLDMLFHRLGNPAAAYTAIRSGVFQHGYFPFGDGITVNPYTNNSLVSDAALALYRVIRRHSVAYFPDTGLSKGEYKQSGREFKMVYEAHPEHAPTMRILAMMSRFGARIKQGDAFISGGPSRPTNLILAENPQLLNNPDYEALREAA